MNSDKWKTYWSRRILPQKFLVKIGFYSASHSFEWEIHGANFCRRGLDIRDVEKSDMSLLCRGFRVTVETQISPTETGLIGVKNRNKIRCYIKKTAPKIGAIIPR